MRSGLIGIFIVGLLAGAIFARSCIRLDPIIVPDIVRDTVIIRDTIWPPIPEPEVRLLVRYDTVWLPTLAQVTPTDTIKAIVPITESEYKTDDYRAIVEGYNARLVSMELFPQTTTITNTVTKYKRPVWAVTVGPGVGYGPKGIQPYVGVTAGVVLWSR